LGTTWEQTLTNTVQNRPAPDGSPVPITPVYALSDGSVTITSSRYDAGILGTLFTLDQSGNFTSQTADTGAAYSWTNNWYVDTAGTLSSFASLPLHLMSTFAAFAGGNQSRNGSAIEQQWYPPLAICHD
jgi:hypothetical protein